MRISVIIPSWRRPDDLARCLRALAGQSRPADEVLVVVRNDDHATRELLEGPQVHSLPLRRVEVTAPGAVAALRAGAAEATGDVLAITDDDAEPWPDWLERMEGHFMRDRRVGGVGGRDRLRDRPHPALGPVPVGMLSRSGRRTGNHHIGSGAPRAVHVLKGVNMSVRAEAVHDDWFDPRLRGQGAQVHWELALCLALRHSGWTLLYDPAVGVDHHPAPRAGAARHTVPPLGELADEVHNESYALARWLPRWQALRVMLYGLLVGTRRAPGLLTFLERLPREPDRATLWRTLRVAVRARIEGARTAATGRRSAASAA